jgi:L-iditol 2-dehydrogenase
VARSTTLEEVRLEQVDDPVPAAGDVVCDVLACGVCASDVLDWYVKDKLPAVLGHEPAGLVSAVGEGVRTVKVGDRVAIHHHAPCGECRRCRRGHETLCERFRSTGLEPGGFAERVRIPSELVDELLVLPDGLDAAQATLIEPLACVLRAQERASLRAGDSLLVVGAGVNGLLQIAAAQARGVAVVWAREPRPDRLALATAWGAEHHGNELVDVAMVCTPKPDAIAAAAQALAPGGTLCLYAPPAPHSVLPLDGTSLFLREITVTASYSAGPADMRAALELLADGTVDAGELVTHRLPLEETARALSLQRRGEALKAVVVPRRRSDAGVMRARPGS